MLLHASPAHAWTLEELATKAGASRSALADRFAHFVGYPPIQYLTQWRMQMAAKRLADRSIKVAAIAREVGYESEAAFSRAFKKFAASRQANGDPPHPEESRGEGAVFVPMARGFVYLVAVIDCFSREVLSLHDLALPVDI